MYLNKTYVTGRTRLVFLMVLTLFLLNFAITCTVAETNVTPPNTSIVTANTAIVPTPRDEKWIKRHEGFLEQTKQGNIDVVFLGDSITDFFRKPAPDGGSAVWEREFAPLRSVNYGISADRTQHVLWRIANGELDGINPKALVLLIGTNNTGFEKDNPTKQRNTASEAIEGVKAVVQAIRTKLPQTKILLISLFPREDGPQGGKDSLQSNQVREINAAIAKLHDGNSIQYIDVGSKFLDTNGNINKDLVISDKLHPNEKGYEVWVTQIKEPLLKILKK